MHRDKFPEKVPFRLTRMLIKAMEVAGVRGTFFAICKKTMDVLRREKVRWCALRVRWLLHVLWEPCPAAHVWCACVQPRERCHAKKTVNHGCCATACKQATPPRACATPLHPTTRRTPPQESVMAMLEAFVHDPLINWRLLNAVDAPTTPTNATGGGLSPVPVQPATGGFVDTIGGEVQGLLERLATCRHHLLRLTPTPTSKRACSTQGSSPPSTRH